MDGGGCEGCGRVTMAERETDSYMGGPLFRVTVRF